MRYFILLLFSSFLLFGCTQQAQNIYVCPDGNKVLNPDDCKYHQIVNATPSIESVASIIPSSPSPIVITKQLDLQNASIDEIILYCESLNIESLKQICYPRSLGSSRPSASFECESLQNFTTQTVRDQCFFMASASKALINETFPCERILNQEAKDHCLLAISNLGGSTDYCSQMSDQSIFYLSLFISQNITVKDYCYYSLGYNIEHADYCNLIQDQMLHDTCYSMGASKLGQKELCNFIKNQTLRDACINPRIPIRIAVVGKPSDGLKAYLASSEARSVDITYSSNMVAEQLKATGTLKPFDVVILQGQPICDRTARSILTDWVKAGGKLIVVADACTRVYDDNSAVGWDIGVGLLGDIMPVKIGGLAQQPEPIKAGCSSGTLRKAIFDHMIMSGVNDYPFSGRTIDVVPYNGNIVAYVECTGGGATTPAIIESTGMFSGKVVYFSYDPGIGGDTNGRTIFINTIKYLVKQKG